VAAVPQLVDDILKAAGLGRDDIELYLLHQATRKMLSQLRESLNVSDDRLPIVLEHCGNTVSSTLPIVLDELRRNGRLRSGSRNMLVGFGVGLSWAGCIWTESWQANTS
jgi:3-oxoacyl-[acyl-carrier-protein] synthase-3